MYFKISDGKYWGLYGSWLNAFKAHHIIGYYFNSKEDMLKSGKLQKGDILIIDPSGEGLVNNKDADGNVRDGHTGFFWGDSSSEDKFWHSDHHMVNGQTVIMSNVISEITGKLSAPYNNYLVIPLGEPGEGDPGLVRVKKLDKNLMRKQTSRLPGQSFGLPLSLMTESMILPVSSDRTAMASHRSITIIWHPVRSRRTLCPATS